MRLQFIGAAQTVTGSMHLLEVNGKRILLECGFYHGKRSESIRINKNFDFFRPEEIDTVVLSHAHIDHSGNLPNLVKQGFSGTIYATPATRDLTGIMLTDSAKIQEQDAHFLNKKLMKKREPLIEPIYTTEDALSVMPLFVSISYHRETAIADGVTLKFLDAGHILGSAMVQLRIHDDGTEKNLLFTGDLGRKGLPILKNPEVVEEADLLITESTYGGKLHDPIEGMQGKLREVIVKTVSRGGKVIIPAFSVERTQEITYTLHRLFESRQLPRIPVFVDSPLSVNATEVFRLHPECFNSDVYNLERQPVLKIFGEEYPLRAEVVEMHSFSAHADHNDLVSFASNFNKDRLRNIFLVHGEKEEQSALSQSVNQIGFKNVVAPKKGESFNI